MQLDDQRCKNGNFFEPCILTNLNDQMEIVREEVFGPVLTLLTFEDEKEVVQRANNSKYGLAAGLFTNNLARAHRVASQLQAGYVWINNYNVQPVEVPFGGYKMSGFGRELGLAALENYTQLKSVYVELGDVESLL
uniref:Aldehyde dehydrogenase domain-containing protein n=1 Tax=Romanomermis culicivorax TaxID=13658 RepID=A0A915ILM8_ROMCU